MFRYTRVPDVMLPDGDENRDQPGGLIGALGVFAYPLPTGAYLPNRFFCKGGKGNPAPQYSERQDNRDIRADNRVPKPGSPEFPYSHAGCNVPAPDKFRPEARIQKGRR